MWVIDTVYYKDVDVKACLLSNIIIFHENKQCKLPYSESRCLNELGFINEVGGKWILEEEDSGVFFLNFKTGNRLFNGVQRVWFYKGDDEGLLKMELYSDSLYMICSKWLYDYRKDIKNLGKVLDS